MSDLHQRSMNNDWPDLPFEAWSDTCATLHMWLQMVGKIRLVQSPWVNHSWHSPLYLTARGLTTSPIPYGARSVQIDIDFIDHVLSIQKDDGLRAELVMEPRTVADFYTELFGKLGELGLDLEIHTTPSELKDAIPFEQDREHASYDPEYAHRFWRALCQVDRVFKEFRARFIGKCSPVHFFWGSFDIAVTRFSGREAPPHPGGVPNFPDWVAREAYSHEVSSAGFWPGGSGVDFPAFYSYAYPAPDGFRDADVGPQGASFSDALGEFVLPYDEVRLASSPDDALLEFLQSTYVAAAGLGSWDRSALERTDPLPVAKIPRR
jgi:hypothetical protein